MPAPGPFFYLCRDGLVPEAALAPLLELLPEERYIRTAVRGGEGLDSTRWPIARDAELASFVARRLPDPDGHVAQALAAIEAAHGDPAQLRAIARRSFARTLPAGAASILTQIWRDATDADRAHVGDGAPLEPHLLAQAHHNAADGLYAYHCARGLPGYAAEHAAQLARDAIAAGHVTVAELIAAAVSLTLDPPGSARDRPRE